MKAPGAPCCFTVPPGLMRLLAVAAAAGKQNDSNDDQPKGAVFKQIAKAVIHNRSSKNSLKERVSWLLCYHIMTMREKCAKKLSVCVVIYRIFWCFVPLGEGFCEQTLKSV